MRREDFYFNYIILFKDDNESNKENYEPIVSVEQFSKGSHGWDINLSPTLPLIWYVLNLPRFQFDLFDLPPSTIYLSTDDPHNILVLPYNPKNLEILDCIKQIKPILILCPDDIYEAASSSIELGGIESELGIVRKSDISSKLLRDHWNKLLEYSLKNDEYIGLDSCLRDNNFTVLENSERKIIPLLPMANRLGRVDSLLDYKDKEITSYDLYKINMNLKKFIEKVTFELEVDDKQLASKMKKYSNFKFHHAILTATGTPFRDSGIDNKIEEEVINVLSTHRGVAKESMVIEIGQVPKEAYDELNKLEMHVKDAFKLSNKYVWRTLEKIGKILITSLSTSDLKVLKNIEELTIFSDFPIGLAILPDETAPMCCSRSISYKPLTPLTRQFQIELYKKNLIYLGKNKVLTILLIECVEKDDKIRSYCDGLYYVLKNIFSKDSSIKFLRIEATSVKQMISEMNEVGDVDITIFSAHGFYDIGINQAGLVVGNEMWMGAGNYKLPPLVLLSACHVSPRGKGVVSVTDLMIRQGAMAVLGTQVPVDVQRNATLIVRLLTYINDARNGEFELTRLDKIWEFVVSSNAFHEITSSNNKLIEWAYTEDDKGITPNHEFKLKASTGKLRKKTVYKDTEEVLIEMTKGTKMESYFQQFIASQGYFPESVFYQFIGSPENIMFYNELLE